MSLALDGMPPYRLGNMHAEPDAASAFSRYGTSCGGIGIVSTCPPFVVTRRYERWIVAVLVRRSTSTFMRAKSSPLAEIAGVPLPGAARYGGPIFSRKNGQMLRRKPETLRKCVRDDAGPDRPLLLAKELKQRAR